MMRLNIGLKSALLGLAVISAAPVATMRAQQVPNAIPNAVVSFVKDHKAAFVAATAWFIIDVRLNTRTKEKFSMNDLQQDFKDLLNSLNIFDVKLYKQLVFLFDKYVIGLQIKLYDAVEPREKNDVAIRIKNKYLDQKPFGLYGLFDAYVMKQMKRFTDYVPMIAGFYVLLGNPELMFGNAVEKASK